jgi:hypothetical protein
MPNSAFNQIAIIGIDIGKNSFHIVGLEKRGGRSVWSSMSYGGIGCSDKQGRFRFSLTARANQRACISY